jgi:hypothetical protein
MKRPPPPAAARARPASDARRGSVLGPEHPLIRAIDGCHIVERQCTIVVAVLCGSGIASVEGRGWAEPLAVAAAITLAVLAVVAVSLRQCRRDHVIDVILEGREDVGLAVVQRERARLQSARTRRALARGFAEMVDQATHPQKLQMRGARPLYHLAIVVRVASELLELVSGLEREPVSMIGVARAERLVTDGMSPLYGLDAGALRSELRRIISQLGP